MGVKNVTNGRTDEQGVSRSWIYLPGNCGLHQIFLLATVCTSVSGLLFATPRNKLKICQNLRQPPTHQLPGRAISTFIPHRIAWCSTINNWVRIIALLHKWVWRYGHYGHLCNLSKGILLNIKYQPGKKANRHLGVENVENWDHHRSYPPPPSSHPRG